MSRLNLVCCGVWIPRGVARNVADKVELGAEELKLLMESAKEELDDMVDEDEYDKLDVEKQGFPMPEAKGDNKEKIDDEDDIDKIYNMDSYTDDPAELRLSKIGKYIVHSDNKEDQYYKKSNLNAEDSDDEDVTFLKSDNLIAVGRLEDDAANLEVHVYNRDKLSFYVHHDILLSALPFCMEWINFDPEETTDHSANLVAVGSMSPVVDIWDLNIVNSVAPVFKLGKRASKKKRTPGIGHTDAVLSLAWNKNVEHVLASGSVDKTAILWDLETCSVAETMTSFKGNVQALQWHQTEKQCLLSGSSDRIVRIFDCRSTGTYKKWKLDGEIEAAIWNNISTEPYQCLASTDQGTVYCIDAREDKPLWSCKAHEEPCTGLQLSPSCPGCLVTVSSDKTSKVWDILEGKPKLVTEIDPRIGSLQFLSACSDAPFIFCMGGDDKKYGENLKVLDIRNYKAVRAQFCKRVNLPEDLDVEQDLDDDDDVPAKKDEVDEFEQELMDTENALTEAIGKIKISNKSQKSSGAASTSQDTSRPKPKFGKKKGGHLDKFRKKR